MKKTVQVDNFLKRHQHTIGHSQFTSDFIEDMRDEIEEYQEKPAITVADFLHSLSYDVGNVLEIMRRDLPEYQFFHNLDDLLERLAKQADNQRRHVRLVEKAGLN